MINMELARQRNLDYKSIKKINKIYKKLAKIIDKENKSEDAHTSVRFMIEAYEYQLQELWKFPLNPNFHRYSYRLDKCTCAKMDNMEYIGTPYRSVSENCPYHAIGYAGNNDDA